MKSRRIEFRDNLPVMLADAPWERSAYLVDRVCGREFYVPKGMPLAYGGPGGHRGIMSHDGRWYDSTGGLVVGELERLDQKLHEPLVTISWDRDIDLREDVTIADEISSFTLSNYGSPGGLGTGNSLTGGKAWMTKDANEPTSVSLDIAKNTYPLTPWGIEVKFTIFELESAAKAGRPVDQQKFDAMRKKHDMDIDAQVYIGDTDLQVTGLITTDGRMGSTSVSTTGNVVKGGSGATQWALKSQVEILNDINTLINATWAASAWEIIPSRLLLPPVQYGLLTAIIVSSAGSTSIMEFVKKNNIYTANTGRELEIYPCKWLIGAATGGTIGTLATGDRMCCYTKNHDLVRFPKTPLQRTPLQFDATWHKTTYFCRLGVPEIVYVQSIGYADGI